MAEVVDVHPAVLPEVADRLAEKRMAVEKEVNSLGEAPSNLKDVFELCRGFEKAFSTLLNSKNLTQKDTPTAAKIKDTFMSEKGLAGQISKLQLDDLFKLDNVKKVCKQADGYQPHLVSPEKGLRLLASEALARVNGPVKSCVFMVYQLLLQAARDAADQAGAFVEGVSPGLKEPVQVPSFKIMVLPAVNRALEDWRDEAEKMALMLVDMERSYITAGFFRYTMDRRLRKANAPRKTADKPPPSKFTSMKNKFMRKKDEEEEEDDDASSVSYTPAGRTQTSAPSASSTGTAGPPPVDSKGDLVAAYFEKSQSEGSFLGRGWQKRFFIYKHSMKTLYYFKSAEDVQKPDGLKGQVLIADCIVEDIDEKGNQRTPRSGGDSVYLRIRHKDPSRAAVKDNNSLVLKAETVDQKVQWLAMLQAASGAPPKPAAAAAAAEPSPSKSRRNSVDEESEDKEAEAEAPAEVEDEQQEALWEPYIFNEGTFAAATHLGEGAPIFRADNVRDAEGRLMPAAGVVLGSKFDNRKSADTYEGRYDQLLDQFGEDMCVYIRMVCDTIINTVPKAVIHSMVKRAETHLLNRLFAHVHGLSEPEMKRLLEEDENTVRRRSAAKKALEDIKKSIALVHHVQEEVHLQNQKRDAVKLNGEVLAYAGLFAYLPRDIQSHYRRLVDDPYAPRALKEEYTPKTNLAALADAAKQAAKAAAAPVANAVAAVVGRTPSAAAPLARPSVPAPGTKPSEPVRRPPPPPPGAR